MAKGGFTFNAPTGMAAGHHEYFAEYSRQRELHFNAPEDEDVEVVEAITVLEQAKLIDAAELGPSPKKVYKAAHSLGWVLQASRSLTSVAPVLYASNSSESNAKQYQVGDVRSPGYTARHYWLEARHPEMGLGFSAHWEGEGEDGVSASFDLAKVFDPVGIPVENFFDYTKNKLEAKAMNWNEARRIQEGKNANQRINDGTDRLEHERVFLVAGEFFLWLDDWLAMAGLPTVSAKPKATKIEAAAARDAALIGEGLWVPE